MCVEHFCHACSVFFCAGTASLLGLCVSALFLMTVQLPAALFIIDQPAVCSGLLSLIGSEQKNTFNVFDLLFFLTAC